MTSNRPRLLDDVAPSVRLALVSARRMAYRNGSSAGLVLLDSLIAGGGLDARAKVAVQLLRCELLTLDNLLLQAGEHFDSSIEPLLNALDDDDAILLLDNRGTIAMDAMESSSATRFYESLDLRNLLGVEQRDTSEAYYAERAANQGDHHSSLPRRWRQLQAAYRTQNWQAFRWAHSDFGRECIAINLPGEGVWHGIQALDHKLVDAAAERLLESRSAAQMDEALKRVLGGTRLVRHLSLAASFVAKTADCIPNAQVERVLGWLQPCLTADPTDMGDFRLFEAVWNAIESLGPRVKPQMAYDLAKLVAAHPQLTKRTVYRRHLIKAFGGLLFQTPKEKLPEFVGIATGLATKLKSDIDYGESLNMICNMAKRNHELRRSFRDALYPHDAAVTDPILVSAGRWLDWTIPKPDQLNESVPRIAAVTRRQVEFVAEGSEPAKGGAYFTITKEGHKGKHVIHAGLGQLSMAAAIAHRDSLTPESVSLLVQALVHSVSENRNVIVNRTESMKFLKELLPKASGADRAAALLEVKKIANGEFEESDLCQSHADATNSLNPFKMGSGNPDSLRGLAVWTIAEVSVVDSTWSSALHDGLLADCVASSSSVIREFSLAAARDCDALTEAEVSLLSACAFDESASVRVVALDAIAHSRSSVLTDSVRHVVVSAIRRSSRSADRKERAAAARAALALLRHSSGDGTLDGHLRLVVQELSADISHLVRLGASTASK